MGSTGLSHGRNQGIGQAGTFSRSSGSTRRRSTCLAFPVPTPGPGMPLVAGGFQLWKTGMPFAIVLGPDPTRPLPGPIQTLIQAPRGPHQPKGTVSPFNPPNTRLCLKVGSAGARKVLGGASWELKGFDLPEPERGILAPCCLPEAGEPLALRELQGHRRQTIRP